MLLIHNRTITFPNYLETTNLTKWTLGKDQHVSPYGIYFPVTEAGYGFADAINNNGDWIRNIPVGIMGVLITADHSIYELCTSRTGKINAITLVVGEGTTLCRTDSSVNERMLAIAIDILKDPLEAIKETTFSAEVSFDHTHMTLDEVFAWVDAANAITPFQDLPKWQIFGS